MPGISKAEVSQLVIDRVKSYTGQLPGFLKYVEYMIQLYVAVQQLLQKFQLIRSGPERLNELQLEGLHHKDTEVLYMDHYNNEELTQLKSTLKATFTAIIISVIFYFIVTYLMNFSLALRILISCTIATMLIVTLTTSDVAKAILYLAIPTMAHGNLKSALVLAAIILILTGPYQNKLSNLNSVKNAKWCLAEETIKVYQVGHTLVGKQAIIRFRIMIKIINYFWQTMVNILHRKVYELRLFIENLKRKIKQKFKFLNISFSLFRIRASWHGSCNVIIRALSKRFRDTKLLLGIFQMVIAMANLFMSGSTPMGKPTVGHVIHKIGGMICPKLAAIRKYLRDKKAAIKRFREKIYNQTEKVIAVLQLFDNLTSPGVLVIRFQGGLSDQFEHLKIVLREAVLNKTKKFQQTQRFVTKLSYYIIGSVSFGLLVITIAKAGHFYWCFMHDDEFENEYITSAFVRLDEIEQPVLPLDSYEKSRVKALSEAMIANITEKISTRVLVFSLLRIFPVIYILVSEYIVFIITLFLEVTFRFYMQFNNVIMPELTAEYSGNKSGNLFILMFSVVQQIQRLVTDFNVNINVVRCSPVTKYPNYALDVGIIFLVLLYVVFTALGPFFLKLRHHMMVYLFPYRALQRAVWLRRHIEADRLLLPTRRDLLRQREKSRENGLLKIIYDNYIKDTFVQFAQTFRGIFNLSTVNCALCGITGNRSISNFHELFTMCDSCSENLCCRCIHEHNEEFIIITKMKNCPLCHGELEIVDIDEQDLEPEDPLNRQLQKFLDLRPDYRVAPQKVDSKAKEIQRYNEEMRQRHNRSLETALGLQDAE